MDTTGGMLCQAHSISGGIDYSCSGGKHEHNTLPLQPMKHHNGSSYTHQYVVVLKRFENKRQYLSTYASQHQFGSNVLSQPFVDVSEFLKRRSGRPPVGPSAKPILRGRLAFKHLLWLEMAAGSTLGSPLETKHWSNTSPHMTSASTCLLLMTPRG